MDNKDSIKRKPMFFMWIVIGIGIGALIGGGISGSFVVGAGLGVGLGLLLGLWSERLYAKTIKNRDKDGKA
jgi:hypothetical protein